MAQLMLGLSDLVRRGYYDSESTIRSHIQQRKLPPPFKVGGKLRWKTEVIEKWMADGSIRWIPRRNKS